MNLLSKIFTMVLLIVIPAKNRNLSQYPIDDPTSASVTINNALLGTWKVKDDKNKSNFILVQCFDDVFQSRIKQYGSFNKYIDVLISELREGHNSTWNPDTDETVVHYRNALKNKDTYYYITYFNHDGKNPVYQQWNIFFSNIGNHTFANIHCTANMLDSPGQFSNGKYGYLLTEVINGGRDKVTLKLVNNDILRGASDTKGVRDRLTRNINNKKTFDKSIHLYKLNDYHQSFNGAIKRANANK